MSSAYTLGTPFPLTYNELVDVTTTGYKWYFPYGQVPILNWSVSSSKWIHPTLQSTETQADFAGVFSSIAEFTNVRFNFIGYIAGSATSTGYQRAADLGSDLNITFSYDGWSNGNYIADGAFHNSSSTAFGYFPDSDYNAYYKGAAGDVWMNLNNPFIASLSFEQGTNGYALLLHEVLHGLGLKHPHDDGGTGRPTYAAVGMQYADRQWISVMSYDKLENGGDGAYTGSMPIGPMIFDAIALQYLYGESNFNAGDTRYDLTRYIGNYYNCQWDASGIDTLDGSALGFGIVADLGSAYASNGYNTHSIGFITTAADYVLLAYQNPTKWTWLWGEYENLTGSAYADDLTGNALDNVINGGAGNDYLVGQEGNDTFDWDMNLRGGNDTMVGGLGDDRYVLDSVNDVVVENSLEGVDTVYVGFNYSLVGSYLENLSTFVDQTLAVELTGNDWHNAITGGLGNDILRGNAGDDQLTGGAGNDSVDGGAGTDSVIFSGNLQSYFVRKTSFGYTVQDSLPGRDGFDSAQNVEKLAFANFTVNLTIQNDARFLPSSQLNRVVELYVAFFNRTPDADGLDYWIGRAQQGTSINSIAEGFYGAGVHFGSLTGFSATMSNSDFVNVVYRNVLGRTGGADAGGLAYWTGRLASGQDTHGSLVSTILDSAHTFKGNAAYGWVADLLDNKIAVASTVAIAWGLNYNSSEAAISNGMAIAAAITPTGTADALSLVGVHADMISLT